MWQLYKNMLPAITNASEIRQTIVYKKSLILDSFRTAKAEQVMGNIINTGSQKNAAFVVSSPSMGIGKSERMHILKKITVYIKNAKNFSAILFI